MTEDSFIARNHCLKESSASFSKLRRFIHNKFGIWDVLDLFPYRWRMFYYDNIKVIFKPNNQRLRKFIPRQWCDISHLMVDINFEMIKIFYQDEYKQDIVDWNATEQHKEFAEWLEQTYKYITFDRPLLEEKLEKAYPPSKGFDSMFTQIEKDGKKMYQMVDDGIPYEVKYAEVNRIEKLIFDTDTEVLHQFSKRREYFWT
jgi:hypothetical protein